MSLLFDTMPGLVSGASLAAMTSVDLPDISITARDYQDAAIENAFRLWDSGVIGVMVRQPTGTGKTVVGALIARRWLSRGPEYRVLVIAHERQLVWQFHDELEDILGIHVRVEMGSGSVPSADISTGSAKIVVACRPTLIERTEVDLEGNETTYSRLEKFDRRFKWLVIWDEAHRHAYKLKSCRHIVDWFDAGPDNRRLGLTATPMRGDNVSLSRLFPQIATDYRLYDVDGGPSAVNDGWCVPYDQRFIVVEGLDFTNLREVAGDFRDDDLEALLNQEGTLAKLCNPMMDIVGLLQTLIFSPGVDMAKNVARYLNAHVRPECAKSLDGSIPEIARKQTYKEFQESKFQYLSVCGLCREGYNNPNVQAIACFRPTKSLTLAEQIKGRGCRTLRGCVTSFMARQERLDAIALSAKPRCIIIDLVGITGLADTASAVKLMAEGKPDEVIERAEKTLLKEGGDAAEHIRRAEADIKAEREKARLARIERETKAQEEANRRAKLKAEVRYTATHVQQGHGGRAAHHGGGGGKARMLFGKHKGELISTIGTWALEWYRDNTKLAPWLRAAIVSELDSREPEPATQKQIWKMKHERISVPEGCTKSQASRLIESCKKAETIQEREPGCDDF